MCLPPPARKTKILSTRTVHKSCLPPLTEHREDHQTCAGASPSDAAASSPPAGGNMGLPASSHAPYSERGRRAGAQLGHSSLPRDVAGPHSGAAIEG